MIPFSGDAVEQVFRSYPDSVRECMFALRDLVFTTASRLGLENELQETLKWGEPAYLCQSGSPLRMHWKENDPDHYRMFFHCQTSLVETFREVFPENFSYEGNRAICFLLGEEPDLERLALCVEAALNYHQVKDLDGLGLRD